MIVRRNKILQIHFSNNSMLLLKSPPNSNNNFKNNKNTVLRPIQQTYGSPGPSPPAGRWVWLLPPPSGTQGRRPTNIQILFEYSKPNIVWIAVIIVYLPDPWAHPESAGQLVVGGGSQVLGGRLYIADLKEETFNFDKGGGGYRIWEAFLFFRLCNDVALILAFSQSCEKPWHYQKKSPNNRIYCFARFFFFSFSPCRARQCRTTRWRGCKSNSK